MPERTHRDSPEPRRQVVSLIFYKVQPEWRRLPASEKAEHRREFASVIARWRESEQMTVLTYSMCGLRADADLMLWRICYSLECLQQMQAELMGTALGAYLETPHSYLAMTRRSQYKIGHGVADENVSSKHSPGTRWHSNIVDLKMRLRETENATYTQKDTPVFTGIQCDTEPMLEQLG